MLLNRSSYNLSIKVFYRVEIFWSFFTSTVHTQWPPLKKKKKINVKFKNISCASRAFLKFCQFYLKMTNFHPNFTKFIPDDRLFWEVHTKKDPFILDSIHNEPLFYEILHRIRLSECSLFSFSGHAGRRIPVTFIFDCPPPPPDTSFPQKKSCVIFSCSLST